MIVSLRPEIFRADNSSLKRHLSTVVQQALSTLPDTPFGQRNLANYNAAKRAVRESQSHRPSWLEKHTPRLKNVSIFGGRRRMNFGAMEKLQENEVRYAPVLEPNGPGGLGHVTYDYHESLGLDGADVASIFPLWNWIKGVVKHVDGSQTGGWESSLPPSVRMGRAMRVLGTCFGTPCRSGSLLLPSYHFTTEGGVLGVGGTKGSHFIQQDLAWQCRKTLELQGKEIFFDVYAVKAKYSGQPIFNVDAYVMEIRRFISLMRSMVILPMLPGAWCKFWSTAKPAKC